MRWASVRGWMPAQPWRLALLGSAAVAGALSMGSGRFYRSNQNTYLLEAVGPSYPSLRSDWLLGTTDAFPVFSRLARVVHLVGGETALAVLTVLAALVAFAALGAVAYVAGRHTEAHERRAAVAAAVVVALAALQRVPASAFRWMPDGIKPDTFRGVGGQYLLSFPGMLQPSDGGVLLLAAAALCLVARGRVQRRGPLLSGAAALSVVACSLHPSYVAPLMVALVSIAVADVLQRDRLAPWWAVVGTGGGAVLAVLLSSPVARAAGGRATEAQEFLAFQRIPHHSLISHWSVTQTVLTAVVIVGGALLSVRLLRSWWCAIVMIATLVISLAAALAVELTRSTMLASVFPWRITVVVVPLAYVFIAVALFSTVARLLDRRVLLAVSAVAALAMAITGLRTTVRSVDAPPSQLIAAVRAADLTGVGLIPLVAEDVRLNGRVPVYVDWKSHPYAPNELAEWLRRVRATQLAYSDESQLCALVDAESMDWVLLLSAPVPTCLEGWSTIAGDDFIIARRP